LADNRLAGRDTPNLHDKITPVLYGTYLYGKGAKVKVTTFKRSKSTRFAVLLAAGALVLAGCSSAPNLQAAVGEPTTAAAGGNTPKASAMILASIGTDAHAAGLLPAAIKTKGEITVGAFLQGPPAFYLDSDGKTPLGYEWDLTNAIAKTLGVKVKIEDMPFGQLINSLKTDRVDYIMSMMSDTVEREKQIDFVNYAQGGVSVLVQKGNPKKITGPNDSMCGKSAITTPGASQAEWAKKVSQDQCVAKGLDPIDIQSAPDLATQYNSLRTGRVDMKLSDYATNVYAAQIYQKGESFQVLDIPLENAGNYGIGINKANPELADAVKAAVQKLMDSGSYAKILGQWSLNSAAIPAATINTPKVG